MEEIKGPNTVLGYHMIMDCYGCDHAAVDSLEVCYKYLDEITKIIKVHQQSPPFVVYTDPVKYPHKAGVSGWVPIVEPVISIHTLTLTDFVMEVCYNYLDEITKIMKGHQQSPPFVVYTDPVKYPDKAGVSGWVPIVESGISIHTLTPTDFVSIDVYSWLKYDADAVRDFTKQTLKPKEIEEKHFLRGEKYVPPP